MSQHSPFRQELYALLTLLGPILISQLSQAGFGFVDAVMAGQVSPLDLAAVALGASIWLPLMLFVSGVLMATTPLVATAVGRHEPHDIIKTVHQALWIALVISLLGMAALYSVNPIFNWLNTPEHLRDITQRYLFAISWGLPAVCFFTVLRGYCEGLGKPLPIMIISLFGLLLNIPINYIFIHGLFGLPAMGGVGCGWASALVMWVMVIALLLYVLKAPSLQNTRLLHQKERPNRQKISAFLHLGLPIGTAIFFEVSIFAMIAILISPLGELQVAGHQIALSVTSLLFMFPLSLAFCMTIRTGQAYGRKDLAAIQLTRKVGLITTALFACLSAAFIVMARHWLASLYTNDSTVANLAASLLLFAAAYQIVDAIQVGAAGSLRGLHDTKGPMIITLIAYWIITLPLGYSLGMTFIAGERYGPYGFWAGLVAGLTIAAVLLNWRLVKQLHTLKQTGFTSEKNTPVSSH